MLLISSEWLERMTYWLYRSASYVQLNFVDDPAWLALIFC